MDLLKLLEKEHSKQQCDRIVSYIGKDPERFAILMNLFFKGEYRITQRAAWPMSYCVRLHPELIQPYFKPLLKNLGKKGIHDAIIRNTMRLLQYVDIPEKYRGQAMHYCFEYIRSRETAVAIRAFSLAILQRLAKQYPEIIPEVRLIIEEQWAHATPAFRSRAKKFLSQK